MNLLIRFVLPILKEPKMQTETEKEIMRIHLETQKLERENMFNQGYEKGYIDGIKTVIETLTNHINHLEKINKEYKRKELPMRYLTTQREINKIKYTINLIKQHFKHDLTNP